MFFRIRKGSCCRASLASHFRLKRSTERSRFSMDAAAPTRTSTATIGKVATPPPTNASRRYQSRSSNRGNVSSNRPMCSNAILGTRAVEPGANQQPAAKSAAHQLSKGMRARDCPLARLTCTNPVITHVSLLQPCATPRSANAICALSLPGNQTSPNRERRSTDPETPSPRYCAPQAHRHSCCDGSV